MPSYKVTDPISGRSATLTGDSQPTEQELNFIFSRLPAINDAVAQPRSYAMGMRETGEMSGETPPMPQALEQGLLSNQKTGFAGNTIRAIPAIVGGSIAGPAGAAAFEAGRQALVSGHAVSTNQEPPYPGEVIGNVAMAGATQQISEFAAPHIAKGIGSIADYMGAKTIDAIQWLGENRAGVPRSAYDFAKNNLASVINRMADNPQAADQLAESFRGAVSGFVDKAEKYYKGVVEGIKTSSGPASPKIDVSNGLADTISNVRNEFGYGSESTRQMLDQFGQPRQMQALERFSNPDETRLFDKFAAYANKLKEATPQQVYYFQRDLNSEIKRNIGKPIGIALGKLKSGITDVIERNASILPDLVKANRAYAAGKDLEELASKSTGANDLVGYIQRAFTNPRSTLQKQALESIGQTVPEAGQAIQDIRASQSALSFQGGMRSLPQTGMGADIFNGLVRDPVIAGGAAAYYGGPWLGAAAAAGASLKTLTASPRLAFAALRASRAIGPTLDAGARNMAQALAGSTPAMAQAIRTSMESYYRSPK